ncbi:hypothetical protein [Paenibacillus glucanolyticus]|uniref:hypothetical protein n=1 Tax=Paenibacillus glucanolyticus TaxID=59843 RepID=UPI00096DEFBF|nr:hypothetical protein [Paenibacillus glucanolyticus]OMF76768.1 hypothetical protein BK142_14715 [Paenibacillus glucanolyticus]
MSDVPARGLSNILRKKRRQENDQKSKKTNKSMIRDFPFFRAIKPKSKFVFRSDYFQIDNSFASILTILHHSGADDALSYFWGIHLIPRNLGNDVSVRRFEHVGRMSESWIAQHQGRAEGLLKNQAGETQKSGSYTSKQKLSKRQQQLVEVATDLMNGSSYLRVAFRLIVKAPTLERLDEAINKINRQYKDRFETVSASPYTGEQKRELSNLFGKIEKKMGRNFMFTSSEFAGSYSLVTRGIEDPEGEYVGQMEGDVNNSAVILDVDKYESHVVIAGRGEAQTLSGWDFRGQRGVDVLGAKLGMSALVRNRRVVHLVLNGAKIPGIGVDLSDITSSVDMTRGDINPFEFFGPVEDELSIFAAHLLKLSLMVQMLQKMPEGQEARIKGELNDVLNQFYVDKRMWTRNAMDNRKKLRLVGIPHEEVPRLPEFLSYLNMRYQGEVYADKSDPAVREAFGFLKTAFRDMLDTNGDLFNTTTSSVIDQAAVSSRVVYDFSSLLKRGRGVMMAQFVNALGYAVGNLTMGDVVILHGVDHLDESVKEYVNEQFRQLNDNGVRVVYIYASIDRMIEDRAFNQFDSADYTLLGGMSKSTINKYEDALKYEVPSDLKMLLEHKERYRYYLRRGFDNIVFANDIQMGFT